MVLLCESGIVCEEYRSPLLSGPENGFSCPTLATPSLSSFEEDIHNWAPCIETYVVKLKGLRTLIVDIFLHDATKLSTVSVGSEVYLYLWTERARKWFPAGGCISLSI